MAPTGLAILPAYLSRYCTTTRLYTIQRLGCTMESLSDSATLVKKVPSGTSLSGGGDRATVETDLSTPSAPSGRDVSGNSPDRVKAINSSCPTGFISKHTNCDNCATTASSPILDHFLLYKYQLAHAPSVFLHLDNKNDESEAIFRVGRKAGSRYFDEGRRKIRKNLRRRLSGTSAKGILMTCTVDTKRYDVVEAWQVIWKQFKKLRDALNQYRMRDMGAKSRLRYVAVLEQTKRGYPHLHVFFPGLKYLVDDLSRLDTWWPMGGKGGVDVEASSQSYSASGYVLKYVGKMAGWSDMSMAFLWAFHIRLYNLSHRDFYKVKEASEWLLKAVYTTVEEMADGLACSLETVSGILDSNLKFVYVRSP